MQFEESTDLIDTSFITEIVVVVVVVIVVVVQREREREKLNYLVHLHTR